jgi:multiple sugar transport system permease protein
MLDLEQRELPLSRERMGARPIETRKIFTGLLRWTTYLILTVVAVAALLPLYWMFTTSVKTQVAYLARPPEMIPLHPTLANFQRMFKHPSVFHWLFNSLFIAISVTSLNLFFASLAGYTFAKKRFPGDSLFFWLYMAVMMVPFQITMVPLFLLMNRFGWVNTYQALIIPAMAWPINVLLMRQAIQSLPGEILDAGKIDGCSEFGLFRRVVLPMSTNGLAVMGIFTFVGTWNDFLWPLVVTTSEKMRTLPVGVSTFQADFSTDYGLLMAGGVVLAIPMFVVFFAAQKYFLQGITMGALKG